jgi:hypothetical protein
MQSGIRIKCKKRFGQFMITAKPQCVINDAETKQLEWNQELFIPLEPNIPYNIAIQFPYMGGTTGKASFNTQLKLDEVQVYEYITPHVMTSPGKVERKK